MQFIDGGITSPRGFRASGVCCGIKKNSIKKDLMLIAADAPCAAAAVYTANRVQADPVKVTKKHLKDGIARAILANSGNANACAPDGEANALRSCEALARELGIKTEDIITNSTGVIGQRLPVEKIEGALPVLAEALGKGKEADESAAQAIMTTDTFQKQVCCSFNLHGCEIKIGAVAKGSGMIHPNMATMLCFITTDCAIQTAMLQKALKNAVDRSFNRISVDGDTSTNDMAAVMASGLAGNPAIEMEGGNFDIFCGALEQVCLSLAKMIARDGEGATKLITCAVTGAIDEQAALKLSMSVTSSSLVKTAMTGADANWGRVLCAMGYAGVDFEPDKVQISFESDAGRVEVCKNGKGLLFDEALARTILNLEDIKIICDINSGYAAAETYGCNLTSEYVRINGDYRS